MSAEYHFVTIWKVRGTAHEVAEVLGDPLGLVRWWPSVYLGVKELEPGDPKTGVGRVVELYTKGWLPYTLRWSFKVTESRGDEGFTLVADGDVLAVAVAIDAFTSTNSSATPAPVPIAPPRPNECSLR